MESFNQCYFSLKFFCDKTDIKRECNVFRWGYCLFVIHLDILTVDWF